MVGTTAHFVFKTALAAWISLVNATNAQTLSIRKVTHASATQTQPSNSSTLLLDCVPILTSLCAQTVNTIKAITLAETVPQTVLLATF